MTHVDDGYSRDLRPYFQRLGLEALSLSQKLTLLISSLLLPAAAANRMTVLNETSYSFYTQ